MLGNRQGDGVHSMKCAVVVPLKQLHAGFGVRLSTALRCMPRSHAVSSLMATSLGRKSCKKQQWCPLPQQAAC